MPADSSKDQAADSNEDQPQQKQEQPNSGESRASSRNLWIGGAVLVIVIGVIVALVLTLGGNNDSSSSEASNGAPSPTWSSDVLDSVQERGYLLCGGADSKPGFNVMNTETGVREGFDADLCRAVAAAIFGSPEDRVQFVPVTFVDRFQQLLDDKFDVLISTTTFTMERNVKEATTNGSFSFSVPYLYNGLLFAGQPLNVECAENLTVSEDPCLDTIICAQNGSTHLDIIKAMMPDAQVVPVVDAETLYSSFINGTCNVIAGEQFGVAESLLTERGYTGDYAYGLKVHSKEPLACVTRDDDPNWSDFVKWVIMALLAAEEAGITQSTADSIGATDVFDGSEKGPFAYAFRDAVQGVGNYGEIYERNLEKVLPRPVADQINEGFSGLIYSFPFGTTDGVAAEGPLSGSTLDEIRTRGFLKCGVANRGFFASFDAANQTWDGFDVDFCRALSAAIFDGETETVEFTDLSATDRFPALANGEVDVLSRVTTVTLSRDVFEPTAGVGFSFAQPNFYDGLTFGGIQPYVDCADALDVTSTSCTDLLICVTAGTTFQDILPTMFPEEFVVVRDSGEAMTASLSAGECNVIAGGVVDVDSTGIRADGFTGEYEIGTLRHSKDPLALVTRQDDPQFSKFVFWVVSALFYAEEEGIVQSNSSQMPPVTLFGPLYTDMLVNAVAAGGNYGEIYARNIQNAVPRGGLNDLNVGLSGPQHYPLPGVVED